MLERLTIKTDICIEPENEIVYHNPNDPEGMYNILDLAECLYSGGEAEAGILMEISRRLAAYEDSGLSPEQVQELVKAKEDGRLVVLPCKVGDIVYADCYGDIIGWEVHQIEMRTGKPTQYIARGDDEGYGTPEIDFVGEDIGKIVFLTREEAEKALQEGLR